MRFRRGIPRYVQIADALRSALRADGGRLPSEHELCHRFKVSRPTVRQALDVLVQEGRVYRHAGRGTFATLAAGENGNLRVIGSVDDMIALGEETWFKLLSRELVQAPANVAQALRLAPASSAYRVRGIRHADTGPFQHVTAWLPQAVGDALSEEDFANTSMIGAIERQLGMPIKLVEQVTDAALAPRQVAELLQIRPRAALLLFERTYFTAGGQPIEHAITYQTGRRYPYRVVLSRTRQRA